MLMSLIAMQFLIDGNLPPMTDMSITHKMVLCTNIFIMIAILEHAIVYIMQKRDIKVKQIQSIVRKFTRIGSSSWGSRQSSQVSEAECFDSTSDRYGALKRSGTNTTLATMASSHSSHETIPVKELGENWKKVKTAVEKYSNWLIIDSNT
jgi:hypothetical protein